MKTFRTLVFLVVVMVVFGGCANLVPVVTKVENGVCKAAAYWQEYIAGPAALAVVIPKIGPLVGTVNELIEQLNSACKSGAVGTDVEATQVKIDQVVKEINDIVGKVEK